MILERRQIGESTVVVIRGSVTIADADSLRAYLENLAGENIPRIVLDLAEMEFICSTGLGAIIMGNLKSSQHGGHICLVNPQPPVRSLLETTRLTKLFRIFDSVDQALA